MVLRMRARTGVELAQVVGDGLLIDAEAAKLQDVAAHVVGVVVARAPLHELVLLQQRLLRQVVLVAAICITMTSLH